MSSPTGTGRESTVEPTESFVSIGLVSGFAGSLVGNRRGDSDVTASLFAAIDVLDGGGVMERTLSSLRSAGAYSDDGSTCSEDAKYRPASACFPSFRAM